MTTLAPKRSEGDMSLAPTPSPPSTAAVEPAAGDAANGGAPLRFRERVRSRSGTAELLVFRLGRERYAVDVQAVEEILDAPRVERSGGSDRLVGLTRHAGRSLQVFDPSVVLVGRASDVADTVLVMRSGAAHIGLCVEDVDDVFVVDLAVLHPPPFELGDDLLLGVLWRGGEITGVLDARALVGACQARREEGAT